MPACDALEQALAALPLSGIDGPAEKFLVLPAEGEPRWLLPQSCRNVDSVLSSWSPYRISSRVKWQAIRAAHRIGVSRWLPNSRTAEITSAARIDWRRLGWNGSRQPLPVIYVGTPGVSRKAVVHLVNSDTGHCDAIVKVPLAAGARQAILREAHMLASLAEEKYPAAPHLIHVDHGRSVSTQTFVPGISGERRFGAQCANLLRSLMLKDETTTIAQHAEALQESAAWDSQPEIRSAVLSELDDTHLLPACWIHGDFAPWNIKQQPGQELLLIDWEDARRGGLPLQDFFHFLHMQDYLFGLSPTTHFAAGEGFARTIGVAPTRCRKLEIAYLAASYLKCDAQKDRAQADFLLRSLDATLRARPRPLVILSRKPSDPHRSAGPSADHSQQIRAQLFAAMIAQFNSAGIRYCVLGGYEQEAGTASSDVDIMVHPLDMPRIQPLLGESARRCGGLLVQAMRHETTGCYFILAKHDGRRTGFLDPDCCTDYRRKGRLWMPAREVIAGRQRYQNFYVPSIADQFIYYLLKRVLKQSITAHQLRRLQHLRSSHPAECRLRLTRFWPQITALAIQHALVEQDLTWFESRLPDLLVALNRSTPVECRFERCAATSRDLFRQLRRALFPTGTSVLVTGGESGLRSTAADGLLQMLSPAFRWTARAKLPSGFMSSVSFAAKAFWARRRSTLSIATDDSEDAGVGLPGIGSGLIRLLFRPDLIFVLEASTLDTEPALQATSYSSMRPRTCTIHLNTDSNPDELIAEAALALFSAGWLHA